MEEIGAKILLWVFPVLASQLDYLIHYKSKIDNLKTQKNMLEEARERLKHDVDTAKRKVMEIEADVKSRLTKYDDIIKMAREILEDDERSATMTYCNGCCPNLMSRYQLSKRADKAALEAKNLMDEGKFDRVGYRESTQVVGTATSNEGYEPFESRRLILTDVLETLKNPNITRIGVYGMGGIGKTMLVKEAIKQSEEDKLFNNYLFVVVSNPPDLKKIQREIAEKLDLELDVESESVLADRLYKRLLDEKILLVMDDIWKPVDLDALGISFGDNKKGSKLLLTSRFHNVVCNGMHTQKEFQVGVLSEDEARRLFEGIVGDLAKIPEIQPNMVQIVKECAGLPIAITTVANALKNQTNVHVWKDFLKQLKMSSPGEIEGMDEKVYKSIKMSYEFLKSNEAKSLLLLCSLHGEDYNIMIEDLLKYGVGLGLFDNVDTTEEARCRVHSLVERLKDSSFLLDGEYNSTVKMHDVIRDVAINIAGKERHMFTIRTANDLQNQSKWEDAVAISFPYINDDLELPNQFECSKLELLLLFYRETDFRIPDSFFEGLNDLKVLKLSENWSRVLPSSLSSLENLQTLCLDGEVENAIIIGELKNLKALSLSLFNIKQLPKEIGQLTHLQLLDLRGCSELQFIPANLLSNLKRLEELCLPNDVEWEVEAQSTERINAMVSELDHLSHLTKLHICIKNAKILPKARVFERLESYRIVIGSDLFENETLEASRILKFNISFQWDDGYKELLRKCEALFLGEMKGAKNILYELDSEGFRSLKHLIVQHNDEIQYIIRSMGVFPILESIYLSNMINLERICYTQLPAESFRNLRVVIVTNCCNLEFVFSSSMVRCFSHLQEMNIEDCKIMSAIVVIEREEEIEVNSDDIIMFANLHSLKLWNLFKLKGFLSVVDSLVLFNGKVVFPNLEELIIKGMDSMKMIWPNQLISDCFGKLETMIVSNCENLTNIISSNMLRMLRNLRQMTIYDCGSIEEVFEIQRTNNVEESRDIAAAELRSLTLTKLLSLKHVWSMDPQEIITFAKLHTIEIDKCWGLKSVFPISVAMALMQLEELEIKDCTMVEEIVAKEEGIETTTSFVFPQLKTLRLQSLPNLKSFCPGKHTSKWPLLKSLHIQDCYQLKILVSNKESVEETNGLGQDVCLTQQAFFFIEKVVFPNLEELKIKDMYSMKMIWPNQLISDCFDKLETMTVSHCTNLTNFVPPNMLKTLQNLKQMRINDCGSIEEVFEIQGTYNVEESCDIAAAELVSLTLRNLKKLKHVWSMDPQGIITFAKLHTIEIDGCCSLRSVFPISVAKALMQLEKLEIKDCATVEEIVAKEGIETTPLFVFPQLTTLTLCNLPELNSFYLGKHTLEWPSLTELDIQNCDKLKIFGSDKESVEETNGMGHDVSLTQQPLFFIKKVIFPNLEELEIKGMDCTKMMFEKLRTIRIGGFFSLKSVFPTSVVKALIKLEELGIENCARVEEIVAKEEGIETTTLFEFPHLTTLILYNLPELKSFYSRKHTLEWRSLKHLHILKCDKLEIFGSNKSSVQEKMELGHHASLIQQPLFFIEKDKFPNLENLTLDDAMNETCGGPLAEFCCNLKELSLYKNNDKSTMFPNVEAPGVSDFLRLKNIVPFSSTSFHHLQYLIIQGSDVLISLITPSTARTLVQLEEILIHNCERMTEIIANEETDAGDEIAFNNLTCLRFDNLPSLTAFHLGNRTIKFPSLNDVRVDNCPKLKIFCSGVLSTPNLNNIWMRGFICKEEDKDLDLNATIKEYWDKLEPCDQKLAEKTDASEGRENEPDANANLERDTTSEIGDTT